MSAGLKKYAAAGIGAAFGAGLSMALTGANELDAATRQLTADAGLTADEAKAASKSMAGLYRDNLQGFGEIGEGHGVGSQRPRAGRRGRRQGDGEVPQVRHGHGPGRGRVRGRVRRHPRRVEPDGRGRLAAHGRPHRRSPEVRRDRSPTARRRSPRWRRRCRRPTCRSTTAARCSTCSTPRASTRQGVSRAGEGSQASSSPARRSTTSSTQIGAIEDPTLAGAGGHADLRRPVGHRAGAGDQAGHDVARRLRDQRERGRRRDRGRGEGHRGGLRQQVQDGASRASRGRSRRSGPASATSSWSPRCSGRS